MNDFFSGLFGHATVTLIVGAVLLSTQPAPVEEQDAVVEVMVARADTNPSLIEELAPDADAPVERLNINFPQVEGNALDSIAAVEGPIVAPTAEADTPAPIEVAAISPGAKRIINDAIKTAPGDQSPVRSLTDAPREEAALAPTIDTDPVEEFAIVTGTAVNLRAGPSTAYARVGRVVAGDILKMTPMRDEAWVAIVHPETGEQVWMHGKFLDPLS